MSSIAVANNLAPVPIKLSQLNVLERQLIAKILPFAKIIALPKHFYTVNMKNVLAGLSKLKEMHSEYKDVSIDDEAIFADRTNNQIIETEHDTADSDIQDALPRNFDQQNVPERRTTEDTTAGLLSLCKPANEA